VSIYTLLKDKISCSILRTLVVCEEEWDSELGFVFLLRPDDSVIVRARLLKLGRYARRVLLDFLVLRAR